MRISWASNNPLHRTGYATQTALVVPFLIALGHEVSIISTHNDQNKGMQVWRYAEDKDPVPVYPSGLTDHSQDVIGAWSRDWQADITIAFLDAQRLRPALWRMDYPGIRSVLMFPVDHEPLARSVISPCRDAWGLITYSLHGHRTAAEQGLTSTYIPHAVDTSVYRPYEQCAARNGVGLKDYQDRFIVGVVAANNDPAPTRKNWEGIIEGYRLFRRTCPTALLYLHIPPIGQYDIHQHLHDAGLIEGKDFVQTDEVAFRKGHVTDKWMAGLYSSFNVLLSPSRGEGFCLPVLEAQACACPVIAGNWMATEQLVFGGIKIPKTVEADGVVMEVAERKLYRDLTTGCELYRYHVSADAIAELLTVFASQPAEWHEAEREKAFKGAQEYDIRKVVREFWEPTLERYAERIAAERRAAPALTEGGKP